MKLDKFLSCSYSRNNGTKNISTLRACLREARKATGRNILNGKKLKNKKHGSWGGIILYFVFIDNLGFYIYEGKSEKRFMKVFKEFSSLKNKEIKAIYSLRNSLTHSFGLFNKNKEDIDKTHFFNLTDGNILGKEVVLPEFRWDGNFHSVNEKMFTRVNIEILANTIEDIWFKVVENIKKEKIKPKGKKWVICF